MEKRIAEYLDTLFDCGPQNAKAYEVRDEMKQNLIDKYHDLLAQGMSPEDAYQAAIDSLGDVSELFRDLERDGDNTYSWSSFTASPKPQSKTPAGPDVQEQRRREHEQRRREHEERRKEKRSPVEAAISGALWLLIVAAYFLISFATSKWHVTWLIFPLGGAIASLISLFFCGNDRKKIVGAVTGAFWPLVAVFYVAVSFHTGAWHITWIIFLIAAALNSLINLIFLHRTRREIVGGINGFMWCGIVAIYFIVSFATHAWYVTWVIFLVGAAISTLMGLIGGGKQKDEGSVDDE